jgi:hypothetical protein
MWHFEASLDAAQSINGEVFCLGRLEGLTAREIRLRFTRLQARCSNLVDLAIANGASLHDSSVMTANIPWPDAAAQPINLDVFRMGWQQDPTTVREIRMRLGRLEARCTILVDLLEQIGVSVDDSLATTFNIPWRDIV